MNAIYRWFVYSAVRSWYGHMIVSLLVATVAGGLAHLFKVPVLFWMCAAATVAMIGYLIKEAGDEMRYRRDGSYSKRRWADRVKASTDRGGDALGPIAVASSLWAAWLLASF